VKAPPLSWAAWLAVALLALAWWRHSAEREGELREKIHAREVAIAALARQAHTVDTAYVTDTVKLARTVKSYVAVRDTFIQHITDTVLARATILAADSTIHACSVALETCEHRVAVRDSLNADLRDLLALERKRRPSLLGMLLTKVTWAAIGYGAGRLTK